MELSDYFDQAPRLRPFLNLGCLMDIPTGRYYEGKNGEMILNGGLAPFTGIGGRGNMGKSLVAHYMMLCALARYGSPANFYDTEVSLMLERLYHLASIFPELQGLDLVDLRKLILTDSTMISGNKWFDRFRDFSNAKRKEAKSMTRTLPFVDNKGNYIQTLMAHLFEIDSLSMFITDSVEGIYDKNQIGDSGANTDALRSAAAKTQMLMQLPNMTAGASNQRWCPNGFGRVLSWMAWTSTLHLKVPTTSWWPTSLNGCVTIPTRSWSKTFAAWLTTRAYRRLDKSGIG